MTLDLGADLRREDLVFQLEAVRTDSGAKTDRTYPAPADDFTATLDFGPLSAGVYDVRAMLLDRGGKVLFDQPPYRVVKVSSNAGAFLKAWIDDRNRAHFGDGQPHFVIGIYDTSRYSNVATTYEPAIDEISQASINMMINYFITNAPISAVDAYTEALQKKGIFLLPTVSNFYQDNRAYPKGLAAKLNVTSQDEFVARYANAFASNRTVAGYYVQDEPTIDKVPRTFHQYQLIKDNDAAGFNLAVLDRPHDVPSWKDAVDVVGVDPYPLWLPVDNYIGEVGDWTRMAVNAVHGSRPVWTVIQFFQADAMSTWPTEQQLHDMSWMAIAEGASGVFLLVARHARTRMGAESSATCGALELACQCEQRDQDLEPLLLSPTRKSLTATV